MLRSFAACCLALVCVTPALAQAPPTSGFRQLAPGVVTTIPAEIHESERLSRHNLAELLATMPNYGVRPGAVEVSPAKNVRFEHDVQALEFSFKPVRFIRVDLPVEGGGKKSTLVWYLVYYVRNTGDKPFRFIPEFSIADLEVEGSEHYDKLLEPAVAAIREREDPKRPLLNSVEISKQEIPPAVTGQDNSVWGVVTWDDVNPKTDRFAITVKGLSNAYKWDEAASGEQPGAAPSTTPKLSFKSLILHFWRPGDAFYEHESEIRYGIPGEVDYRWIYQ